jgi:hypothetical protein
MVLVNGRNVLYRDGKVALIETPFSEVEEGAMFIQVWDCPTCREQCIWGEWLSCPSCRMPQPINSMYTPQLCWVIIDEDLKKSYKDGPFWLCSRSLNSTLCHTVNSNMDIVCSTCSGDRELYAKYFTATLEESIKTGKALRDEQKQEVEDAILEGVQTSVFGDDNVPFSPLLLNKQDTRLQKISTITSLQPFFKWIIGIFVSLIIGFAFWHQFIEAVPVTGTVVGYEWSRTINIEQQVLAQHESSTIPDGAINPTPFEKVVDQPEVPTGNMIPDGSETIEDLTQTISFDCSQTTGSGAAVKKTCTKHPLISVPKMVPETETVYKTAIWYRYSLKEWQFVRDVKASEKNLKPFWPAYTLSENPLERKSTSSQNYAVFLKNNKTGKSQAIYPANEVTWKSYQKGKKYLYNTNRAGMIISKPQLLLRGKR